MGSEMCIRDSRYYRWFYEYSGGKLTDWGAHHVDIALAGLGKLGTDIGKVTIEPVSVVHPVEFDEKGMPKSEDRFNAATKFNVRCTFEDGVELYVRDIVDAGFQNGIKFEGSKGRFLVNRGKLVGKPAEELEKNPLPDDYYEKVFGSKLPKSHMHNFFDCVKSRKQPISDVVSHNCMLDICHAINIAMRLNKKIVFDPKAKNFGDDALANSFISREQRKGYEIEA